MRAREGDLANTAQEMLTTISVVQTYGRAVHEQEKFDRESRSAMGRSCGRHASRRSSGSP